VLSQAIHSLSYARKFASSRTAGTGALHERPSLERLIPSAGEPVAEDEGRDEPRPVRSVVRDDRVAGAWGVSGRLRSVRQRRQHTRAPGAAGVIRRRPADARGATAGETADLERRDGGCVPGGDRRLDLGLVLPGEPAERVDGDPSRHELAIPRDPVGEIRGDHVDTFAAADGVGGSEDGVDPIGLGRAPEPVRTARALDHGGRGYRRNEKHEND
jgi:hypothetical protein